MINSKRFFCYCSSLWVCFRNYNLLRYCYGIAWLCDFRCTHHKHHSVINVTKVNNCLHFVNICSFNEGRNTSWNIMPACVTNADSRWRVSQCPYRKNNTLPVQSELRCSFIICQCFCCEVISCTYCTFFTVWNLHKKLLILSLPLKVNITSS